MAKPVLDAEARRRHGRGRCSARAGGVGIVFGPERTGLTNDELLLADALVSYPVNPAFASLNVAQAVLLFGYAWSRRDPAAAPAAAAARDARRRPRPRSRAWSTTSCASSTRSTSSAPRSAAPA